MASVRSATAIAADTDFRARKGVCLHQLTEMYAVSISFPQCHSDLEGDLKLSPQVPTDRPISTVVSDTGPTFPTNITTINASYNIWVPILRNPHTIPWCGVLTPPFSNECSPQGAGPFHCVEKFHWAGHSPFHPVG